MFIHHLFCECAEKTNFEAHVIGFDEILFPAIQQKNMVPF